MTDQKDIVSFLSNGESYGLAGEAVERIDTHISHVFLVGDRVYKLKRAVRHSYLDYSTPQLRERFCRIELDLNRRTAPDIYLRVRSIVRLRDGRLAFDGEGEIVDWVLEMRRFNENDLFDRLASSGSLTGPMMRDLTDQVARFHQSAEKIAPAHGRDRIWVTIAGNYRNLLKACPPLKRDQIDRLLTNANARLTQLAGLLDARAKAGKVRRCHGDLHLRNICLYQGHPTLFDCIEFSDEMSCIDVLYDLAFLVMDLVYRDRSDFASLVLNRYLDMTPESDGLKAFPLFLSVRAAVRAHVLAAPGGSSPEKDSEAERYLALAESFLAEPAPRLIAIGGFSGTGKSSAAAALAPAFQPPPGARIVRTDVLRKRLFGVPPEVKLPAEAYAPEVTATVYDALNRHIGEALEAGFTAIADAAFLREEERTEIRRTASRLGVPFFGFWLEAPDDVLRQRLSKRVNDASDADASVLEKQQTFTRGRINWKPIGTEGGLPWTVEQLRRAAQESELASAP
jgi:aminoglycoside phosphotransferase family enzyme/predicted kinase